MAVERIQSVEQVLKLSIDLETTGLTQRGTALLNQMLRISFHGLGCCFQLTYGSLTTEVIEIINVIDKGEHTVGFWRIDYAFTRKIGNVESYSNDGLKATIWPGGIMISPSHRMLQMSSKTIRVGILIGMIRFRGLFQTNYNIQTGSIVVSGFCAEVFSNAFAALGPNLAFEYTPFMGEHYNDLIYRVYLREFDAAIGDITITANRSLYVDFTHPYTDLGLATLSRNADASMWIFLKPLSTDLWAVSVCFFILLGFVIWILEHRVNKEFQGSTAQQIGKTFWFSFSTLVYAQSKLQHPVFVFLSFDSFTLMTYNIL
ncbi:Extracellular ligand-binding receptor [Artemisia annua]|uniref:Extracellular ligand-binding receptor n=1 Tax=Artemisia annua TaxID=35608 RepID=A0A2U1MTR0_ARTAN|nr:Extracellular ligand-binding receptor [Artemisia annua]